MASQKKFRKAAPGVTQAVLNNGLVLSYMKLNPDGTSGNTSSIRQLPYTNPGAGNEYIQLAYTGNITYAHISTAVPGVAVTASSGSLEFRYVIIPGSVSGGRSATDQFFEINGEYYTGASLKTMPYQQLCALLNIPE
ncbi:MAG: hypothetical protein NVV59_01685 [Chitinophagaceae bacterium]|nr:hypothetical protein [Chitinophagaceae bacterium]